jgi:hypothetical protein
MTVCRDLSSLRNLKSQPFGFNYTASCPILPVDARKGASKYENDKGAKAEPALSREFHALTPAILSSPWQAGIT